MEDVSDKCWYCKAILPHHRRFGPLLRTTMSYEAIKRVFFLALPDGFVVKVLVANPILLYCVSYHGEKCSNQGARSSPLGPALHIALIMFFLLSRWKMLKSRHALLSLLRNWENGFFCEIKDRFLGPLWIESGERAMRGAGPSEAPSSLLSVLNSNSKLSQSLLKLTLQSCDPQLAKICQICPKIFTAIIQHFGKPL